MVAVGYPLRREVRDLLPKGVLTDKEARLILELADSCDDDTRRGWPGVEWLAEKTDIPNSKRVGEYFASIARKWVELRIPLGHGAGGKPYYSYPGERTRYEFPSRATLFTLRNRMVPSKPGPKVPEKAGPNQGRSLQKGDHMIPEEGGPKVPPKGGPISSISSSSSSSSLSPDEASAPAVTESERERVASPKNTTLAHRLVADLGVPRELVATVVEAMVIRYRIESPGWWINAERNGTLADAVGAVLAELDEKSTAPRSTISRADHVQSLITAPECPHGSPGGNVPKPDDGWVSCASCRIAAATAPVIGLHDRRAS